MSRLLWMLLLVAVACKGKSDQCSEDLPCGFGETCVEGQCTAKLCATSTECDMEQHCDGGTCAAGCQADADCYPGDECLDGKCELAACRSSTLDCAYKEFCDPASGDCYEASGYYCRSCADDGDCGGNGNLCLNFSAGGFCGVTCADESDCPSGFTCVGITDAGGNVFTKQCLTYCWMHDEDGRRSADARPLPRPDGAIALLDPPTCETGARP